MRQEFFGEMRKKSFEKEHSDGRKSTLRESNERLSTNHVMAAGMIIMMIMVDDHETPEKVS